MKLYESSTATLRAIITHPSLQRDKIEETMEAMAEATADACDVDDAIRAGGMVVDNVIDESELEAELKVLVNDVESREKRGMLEALSSDRLRTPTGIPRSNGDEQLENVSRLVPS